MSTLILMIGAPGSGKTTFARSLTGSGTVRLSLDDLREEIAGSAGDLSVTPQAVAEARTRMAAALTAGRDVVMDATSTRSAERATWIAIAYTADARVEAVVVHPPLWVCQERNARRAPGRRVPSEVVAAMWHRIEELTPGDLLSEGITSVRWVR